LFGHGSSGRGGENGSDEIFTNDRHMLAACAAFGLDGRNLIE
jgi:hypothetical protein